MRRLLAILVCVGSLAMPAGGFAESTAATAGGFAESAAASAGGFAEGAAAPAIGPGLDAFLRERSPEPGLQIELPPLDGLEQARAGREVRFSLHPGQPLLGAVPVGVSFWRDGTLEQQSIVTARVQVSRPVLVARRSLRAGTLLGAEDVVLEHRLVASPHVDALTDAGQAVSQKLRRSVRKGEPLREAMLVAVSAIRRGDRVKLRLEYGPLTIETVGRAEESGDTGEWIRVRNLSSRREVLGRIGEHGVVHVEL